MPKLCESAAILQIFDLAKKIKGIILRPAKQCLRPELCQLAANRQILASEKNEDFSEQLEPISRGGLFTRFQIARATTTAGHRGAQRLHRMDTLMLIRLNLIRLDVRRDFVAT
jgi:hypothetical protein